MAKQKKKKKSSPFLTFAILLALAVFLFSGYKLGSTLLEYKAGTDEYKSLRAYAVEDETLVAEEIVMEGEEGEPIPPCPLEVDFASLKAINEDVIGWIYIGALDISYPIVQGEDNSYYLHRTFERKKNFSGSIFVEAQNKPDFTDPNTIIYGHNMKNGSMFGKLKRLTNEEKYQDDPYFWILTPDKQYCYRMFSIKQTPVDSEVYTLFSAADQQFVDYANQMAAESSVELEAHEFTTEDRVATLSTCTSNSSIRYVVQGYVLNK